MLAWYMLIWKMDNENEDVGCWIVVVVMRFIVVDESIEVVCVPAQ